MDIKTLKRHLAELTRYMGENGVIIDPLPRLTLSANPEYADQTFCPTAHYSPVDKSITVYTAGRHPKDILRSYAHELYHHHQNCEGRMPKETLEGTGDPNYAQNDHQLRELEAEAYTKGNLLFRDWTDLMKIEQTSNNKSQASQPVQPITEQGGSTGIGSIASKLTTGKYIVYKIKERDNQRTSNSVVQISQPFQPQGAVVGTVINLGATPTTGRGGGIVNHNQRELHLSLDDDATVFEATRIENAGRSAKVGDFIYDHGWKEVIEVILDKSLPPGKNTYQIKHRYLSDPVTVYPDDPILRPVRVLYKPK